MNWFKPDVKYFVMGHDEVITESESSISAIAARPKQPKDYIFAVQNGKRRPL